MKNLVSRFVKDESGATAIEYGLIAADALNGGDDRDRNTGGKLSTNFGTISTSLK